ncbi:MAG TPA: hypothetical protein VIY68_10450 [Steroidobacteraceae bacterium]
MPLPGLKRADTDDLARNFLALFVGNRDHHAVLALLAARGVMNGPLDAHCGHCLSGRLGIDGVEAQVVMAPRADVRTL